MPRILPHPSHCALWAQGPAAGPGVVGQDAFDSGDAVDREVGRGAAMGALAAALGIRPGFLGVQVNRFAGPVAFAADRGGLRRADYRVEFEAEPILAAAPVAS
ncbi:hypothetical protein [Cryptosporangium phraense]|uniref:hypothetical protein n=1 Tax=Cryptosporangium phraense TaxID=2593070 RepID=UPI00197AAE3E|nr:hypothetical protein [Cryptosporangium phraense]